MNKRHVFHVGLVLLAVTMLLAGSSIAMAAHSGGNVTLKDSAGASITLNTTPYSPKATCTRACHATDGDTGMVDHLGNPITDFVGHNYGSGDAFSTHVQGVIASDNKVYWQASQTKSFDHGVSTGRHSNQGRNEDYNNTFRAAVGDPYFTSSPGMFGKY